MVRGRGAIGKREARGRSAQERGTRRFLGALSLVGAGALLLAACSSSSSSSSSVSSAKASSTAVSSGTAVSASTLASIKSTLAKAEQVPTWTAPGPAVSASVLKGKGILVMPINSEIGACNTQAHDFQALGTKLGANVTLFPTSGQPSQWETGIEDAVSAHDAAIVMLCGIIPGAVAPQLQAAESAGIAVVDGNYNETNNYQYLDGETAVEVTQGMQDDVDYAIVHLGNKPVQALMITSNSVIQGPAASAAVSSQISSLCPSRCSVVDTLDVPIQDWATQLESDVDSALVAHPNINAIFIAFDGMTQFVLPAVEQAHRPGLAIYTWGGSRSVEKLMTEPNSLVASDSGPNEDWDAFDAMDQVIRLLGHHPAAPVSKEIDPNRFWIPSNVSQFFGPGDTYGNEGYGGNTFENDFFKLWGVPQLASS